MEPKEPVDIELQLADLFDNPPPGEPLAEPVPVSAAWDADDDQFLGDLAAKSSLPAESFDPVEIVGSRGLKQMIADDPVTGGLQALDQLRADWNWNMTPGQRSRMLSDTAFSERIGSLIDEFTKAATRKYPDPFDYAADVVARRRM